MICHFNAVALAKPPFYWQPGAVLSIFQFGVWHHYMLKLLSLKSILVKGCLTEKFV